MLGIEDLIEEELRISQVDTPADNASPEKGYETSDSACRSINYLENDHWKSPTYEENRLKSYGDNI